MKIYSNLFKVRDESGEFIDIPAIKGDTGEKGEKGDQGAGADVVDNLTSTSATSSLSANQGKVLEDKKLDTSDLDNKLQETLPTLLVNDGLISNIKRTNTSTDLNDFTTDGYYTLEGEYENYPEEIESGTGIFANRLEVNTIYGSTSKNSVWQLLKTSYSNNTTYSRYRTSVANNSVWTEWVKETNSGNLETQLQETLPTLKVNNGYVSSLRRTQTDDFDTMLDPGYYSIYGTISNNPSDYNGVSFGRLEVKTTNGGDLSEVNSIYQEYFDAKDSIFSKYVRMKYSISGDWTEWKEITSPYRVGDIVIASENVSPAGDFGGTWELVNKGFKKENFYAGSASGLLDEYFTSNEGSLSYLVIRRVGNTIFTRITLDFTNLSTDTEHFIGTLNLNKFGVSSFHDIRYTISAHNSVGNIIVTNVSAEGEIKTMGGLVGNAFSTDYNLYTMDLTYTMYGHMLDDFCDKFYWRKVS